MEIPDQTLNYPEKESENLFTYFYKQQMIRIQGITSVNLLNDIGYHTLLDRYCTERPDDEAIRKKLLRLDTYLKVTV